MCQSAMRERPLPTGTSPSKNRPISSPVRRVTMGVTRWNAVRLTRWASVSLSGSMACEMTTYEPGGSASYSVSVIA